jgi:arsenate reductase
MIMEMNAALVGLSALAQAERLRVFRLLVRVGPEGLPAGAIAREIGLAAPTLSFHLRHLVDAGLLSVRREGRRRVHAVDAEGVRGLLAYLTQDCCQGRRALRPAPGRGRSSRRTVLFVCSENSARSQMAEALLRRRAGRIFAVHSAGIRPGRVHPLTRRALSEAGIDPRGLRAKDLGAFLDGPPIDHAIVVCESAQRACAGIVPFAREREFWPVADPAEPDERGRVRIEAFREARDVLEARVEEWLEDVTSSRKGGNRA